jgi:hypothetical protein
MGQQQTPPFAFFQSKLQSQRKSQVDEAFFRDLDVAFVTFVLAPGPLPYID